MHRGLAGVRGNVLSPVRFNVRVFPGTGIAKVGLDGTLYDQVLDWIFALGLAPARFSKLSGYDLYFAMARGAEGAVALDMSKFFDTNYHYMVSTDWVCLAHVAAGSPHTFQKLCAMCNRSPSLIKALSPSQTSKAT